MILSDVDSGEILHDMRHGAWVQALACTADGRHAWPGGTDDRIASWDLVTGERTGTLSGHTGDVLALAVSPDGRRLVSGSQDTTLLVWDVGAE